LTCSQRKFPAVFANSGNGFVGLEFCFVGQWRTKHCRLAKQTSGLPNGSLADLK
jgi:hypothetical protein